MLGRPARGRGGEPPPTGCAAGPPGRPGAKKGAGLGAGGPRPDCFGRGVRRARRALDAPVALDTEVEQDPIVIDLKRGRELAAQLEIVMGIADDLDRRSL